MDTSSQIVPAVILLAANLMSGKHGSQRWEIVTGLFGWTAVFSVPSWLLLDIFPGTRPYGPYALQVLAFCLITAMSRDYEKVLRPLFPWNK